MYELSRCRVKRTADVEISALTCVLVTWSRPRLLLASSTSPLNVDDADGKQTVAARIASVKGFGHMSDDMSLDMSTDMYPLLRRTHPYRLP